MATVYLVYFTDERGIKWLKGQFASEVLAKNWVKLQVMKFGKDIEESLSIEEK